MISNGKENIEEVFIPLSKIMFDESQPRKAFYPMDGQVPKSYTEYIQYLADSIEKEGLIHAITVEEVSGGFFRILTGECRTRAHLLLKRKAIRARIRNDIKSPTELLLYRLAENIGRKDLTLTELSMSVKELIDSGIRGSEIAKSVGMSEAWVSKLSKVGSSEVRRMWIDSGISNSLEATYLLSAMPSWMQVDVVRRCALPDDDLEKLEKPLMCEMINSIRRSYVRNPGVGMAKPINPNTGSSALPAQPVAEAATGVSVYDKPVEATSSVAKESKHSGLPSESQGRREYSLPEDLRMRALGVPLPTSGEEGSEGGGGQSGGVPVEPALPVNCRLSVNNIRGLLKMIEGDAHMLEMLGAVRCELNIPGELANMIANQLTGAVVSSRQVPAVLGRDLTQLL